MDDQTIPDTCTSHSVLIVLDYKSTKDVDNKKIEEYTFPQ